MPPWLTPTALSAAPSVNLSLSSIPAEAADGSGAAVAAMWKEVEEGRTALAAHKKEAAWRLSRMEQQMESEKARKRREKMEEVEVRIRAIREEEVAYYERLEGDCKKTMAAMVRDAEAKEAKLMEHWVAKQARMTKMVEQLLCGGNIANTGGGIAFLHQFVSEANGGGGGGGGGATN